MPRQKNDLYRDIESVQDQCKKYMNFHILLTMKDGSIIDGIIEDMDPDRIIMLVGEDVMEEEEDNDYNDQRQYFGQGQGRRRRRRRRRFRRRHIPFGTIAALTLLDYPYFAPPYPYNFPFYPYNPF